MTRYWLSLLSFAAIPAKVLELQQVVRLLTQKMNSSEEIQNHDVNAGSATSVHEKDRVILKTVVGLLFVVPSKFNFR